ncbi:MAG: hypothetical protein LBS90_04730, partial [Oscillospiraceae bacterium]|nr:hypothetical protein [Oscillospiraceae bacterium]
TGSVVGSYAVVAKKYPNNCAIAGNPARIVRRDIAWRGEHFCNAPRNLADLAPDDMLPEEYMRLTGDGE